jgi:hypothetical protein
MTKHKGYGRGRRKKKSVDILCGRPPIITFRPARYASKGFLIRPVYSPIIIVTVQIQHFFIFYFYYLRCNCSYLLKKELFLELYLVNMMIFFFYF